jgi:hypothetical protein
MRAGPLPALPLPIAEEPAGRDLKEKLWRLAGASRRIDEDGAWAAARDRFDEGVVRRARAGALFEPKHEDDPRYRGDGWKETLADLRASAGRPWPSTILPGLSDRWVKHWRASSGGHPASAFDEEPWGAGHPAIEVFASGLCPVPSTVQACRAALAAER